MRASRLLSLLMLLQNRGKLTAEQLAAELEVSVRTVYRDIEALSDAGIPVYADRGPAGGYQLLGGYHRQIAGVLAAVTQLELIAALPPELRDRVGRVRQRFHLDAPTWFKDIERPRWLESIAEAIWSERVVEVRYERWERKVVTRRLEPYGLVLKAGVWYLAAKSGGQVRTYRVVRVLAAEVTDERFDRAPDFDLAAYWTRWNEEYGERLYRDRAVVRLSPFAYDLLGYYQGAYVWRAARDTASEPDADGWITATLPIESVRHATFEFLRLGAEVEILEPAELRDRIRTEAEKVTRRYATKRS